MERTTRRPGFPAANSLPRLFFCHCPPAILAAVLPAVSATADAFFTARLGTDAVCAVGIAFPILAAIQTVGFVFGTGGASLLSRALGAGDHDRADAVSSGVFWAALACSVLLAVPGLCFLGPLLSLLGANGPVLQSAHRYAACLLAAAPPMCAVFVLSNLLRAEGHTALAMLGQGAANLFCSLLAPLFIFAFDLGLFGAGLAFPVGYGLAVPLLLAAPLSGKSDLSLRPRFSRAVLRAVGNALAAGAPSLFRQGLGAVAVILLNRAARPYGAGMIAAISVTSRLFLFLYGFSLGTGQGTVPAAGYCYGAGDRPRARKIFLVAVAVSASLAVLLALPTALLAPRLIGLFRTDGDVLSFGVPLLRLFCAVLPLHGPVAVTNLFLQGLGKQIPASLVAAMRQGIFFLPAVFLLPGRLGAWGVLLTQPIADVLTFLFALPFFFLLLRDLKKSPDHA